MTRPDLRKGSDDFDVERLVPLIDAAVQRYVSQMGRRYLGVVAALVALALVIAFAPSKTQQQSTALQASGGNVPAANFGEQAVGNVPVGAQTSTGGFGSPSPALGTTGTAAAPGASGAPTGATALPTGVARSGVRCGPGVRQVSWSKYAAPCVPAFRGNSGGATFHGVTAKTITIVYRKFQTDTGEAIGLPTQDQAIQDLQTLLGLFNKNFELYGRQVVLKVFTGQGNELAEISGQGQAQAQADAQTAYDMGAFASKPPFDTSLYATSLNEKKIIAWAPWENQRTFEAYHPYHYSSHVWVTAEDYGWSLLASACQRMKGLPAIFAGDPLYQSTTRVFGVVSLEHPNQSGSGDIIEKQGPRRCGLKIKQRSNYTPDLSTEAAQATSIVTQLSAAGVTTVLCACDSLMYTFLTQAASQQEYRPEWVLVTQNEVLTRNADPSQAAHAVQIDAVNYSRDPKRAEVYRAFQLAKPGGRPATGNDAYLGAHAIYGYLLDLFNGIQAAGPNLTPENFYRGWASLPRSEGSYGLWKYAPRRYVALGDFAIAWYDPNATSMFDGKIGTWKACNRGARYEFPYPTNMGSGQLKCFGK